MRRPKSEGVCNPVLPMASGQMGMLQAPLPGRAQPRIPLQESIISTWEIPAEQQELPHHQTDAQPPQRESLVTSLLRRAVRAACGAPFRPARRRVSGVLAGLTCPELRGTSTESICRLGRRHPRFSPCFSLGSLCSLPRSLFCKVRLSHLQAQTAGFSSRPYGHVRATRGDKCRDGGTRQSLGA